MPRYEDDEEEEQLEAQSDIDYQSVKELEPESFGNTTVLPAEKLQKIRTQEPENPEPAAVSGGGAGRKGRCTAAAAGRDSEPDGTADYYR